MDMESLVLSPQDVENLEAMSDGSTGYFYKMLDYLEKRVEDGVRYVSSEPYGVEEGKDFILYLPDTPTQGLDEEFLSWWPGQYQEDQSDTLGFYGLYNVDMGYGFFG